MLDREGRFDTITVKTDVFGGVTPSGVPVNDLNRVLVVVLSLSSSTQTQAFESGKLAYT